MKDCRGITLVEILVVVSIISILIIVLGFNFQGWMANYHIESEVKQIQSDLMYARLQAMQRNRCWFVTFPSTTSYSTYEDKNENGLFDAGTDDTPPAPPGVKNPQTLFYSLTAGSAPRTVKMDTRGLIYAAYPDEDPTHQAVTMQVTTTPGLSPDYNCINFTQTRINLGSMNGGICVEK